MANSLLAIEFYLVWFINNNEVDAEITCNIYNFYLGNLIQVLFKSSSNKYDYLLFVSN